ncbi:Juvenile hormone-inducible protein [Nesidiocoris tenuis]|uniref:Juvenile hormone-inducible protein n=1 Tax=Nesidiocoris tenuis TaxID=355587 RepID=A0ABN7AR29_9HEMI|nr:Juvenile hormone-inducible protein [Nesidiocoris tenuis]
MELSRSECLQIAKKHWKSENVDVLSFGGYSAPDAARGLIAISNILWIKVRLNGTKIETMRCFVKTPPHNPFHLKLVKRCRAFYKEAEFFNTIYPQLKDYLKQKIFPVCLYANDTITVLEDLTATGCRNYSSGETFDFDHCMATLKSLAAFNAASFLYEAATKSTIDKLHSDILFISWFSHLPDHPGNKHLMTGAAAIEAVLAKYFPTEPEAIRAQFCQLLRELPQLLLPSSKHRNALSHNDLWGNNVMFRYDQRGDLKEACLIDFQLFGYNPPAHDVYTLLFMNATDDSILSRIDELVDYYYDELRKVMHDQGHSVDEFLTKRDFDESKDESVKVGLASAVLFTHFTAIPEEFLAEIIRDETKLKRLMEEDRVEIIFKSIDHSEAYKQRLFTMINNLLKYLKGEVKF